jgi:putative component of membrane protein insertase Oxa1/YidC/SpoIIIJ protein YidD
MNSFQSSKKAPEKGSVIGHWFLEGYRWVLSPVIHGLLGPHYGCRHELSCSRFFEQRVREEGWVRGGRKGVKRICTCHPWGGDERKSSDGIAHPTGL